MFRVRSSIAVLAAIAALSVSGCQPREASTDRVFVSNEGSNVVSIVDGATGKVEGHLATGARPRGMALSSNKLTLFVAASDSNRIEAWDLGTLKRTLAESPASGASYCWGVAPSGAWARAAAMTASMLATFAMAAALTTPGGG